MARQILKNTSFARRVIKNFFYKLIKKFSNLNLLMHVNGAGAYDKSIIEKLIKFNDPYPYFRAMISEITDDIDVIDFQSSTRKFGKSKSNIFTLYDMGISAIIKYTNFPMRIMVYFGIILSFFSITLSLIFFIYKLLYWETFSVGIAPLVIGMFLIFSFLILFIGLIGEYLMTILYQIRNIPLVFEEEKINFDE